MALRMKAVQDPIVPQVGTWITETPGTISLGQGIVHYPPPPELNEKMQLFWQDQQAHTYSPVGGVQPLLSLIKEKLQSDNKITVRENQAIVVTAGANMAFLNTLFAITDPGDDVIIFSPYYFNHEMAIAMLGCRPVCIELDEPYHVDLDTLRARITPKTRAVVTVSPNNPTGAVYSRETLSAINAICADVGCYHVSDEAYEYFLYDGLQHFSPGSVEGTESHTISLFSLSKSYGFAGWRIGYMVIPAHLSHAVEKVQDTNLICPAVVSQYAAMGALIAGASYPRQYIHELQGVRDLITTSLNELGDLCSFPIPSGAFYFLLKINREVSSLDLVETLIKSHRIAVIPGTAFGKHEGCFLRIAFGALDKSTVSEGIGRLVEGLHARFV